MKTEKYSSRYAASITTRGIPVKMSKSGLAIPIHPRGKKTQRKLTLKQAKEIRERYALGDTTYIALGKEYNVHYSVISKIARGKTYKD